LLTTKNEIRVVGGVRRFTPKLRAPTGGDADFDVAARDPTSILVVSRAETKL
jgi:hypothetical protein